MSVGILRLDSANMIIPDHNKFQKCSKGSRPQLRSSKFSYHHKSCVVVKELFKYSTGSGAKDGLVVMGINYNSQKCN